MAYFQSRDGCHDFFAYESGKGLVLSKLTKENLQEVPYRDGNVDYEITLSELFEKACHNLKAVREVGPYYSELLYSCIPFIRKFKLKNAASNFLGK